MRVVVMFQMRATPVKCKMLTSQEWLYSSKPEIALQKDIDSLLPASRRRNVDDRPALVILDLKVNAALVAHQLEDPHVAIFDGLHKGVPATVDLVWIRALIEKHFQNVCVVATAPSDGLDNGEMLAGSI